MTDKTPVLKPDHDTTDPNETGSKLPPAPEHAQEKGLDALDVALVGTMITSDPPSTIMPGESED